MGPLIWLMRSCGGSDAVVGKSLGGGAYWGGDEWAWLAFSSRSVDGGGGAKGGTLALPVIPLVGPGTVALPLPLALPQKGRRAVALPLFPLVLPCVGSCFYPSCFPGRHYDTRNGGNLVAVTCAVDRRRSPGVFYFIIKRPLPRGRVCWRSPR